jgi:tagatose-1,6-bisphosphate aldolase
MSTIGVYRSLAQCSDAAHTFAILAIDHRDNLIADLQKHRTAAVTADDVVAFKRSIVRAADVASAVLLDPDYGMPAVAAGIVPGRVGLLAPLEVTDYRPHPSQRQPRMIPIDSWPSARARGCRSFSNRSPIRSIPRPGSRLPIIVAWWSRARAISRGAGRRS